MTQSLGDNKNMFKKYTVKNFCYNFTTDGGAASEQIYNTCILVLKFYFTISVILLCNISTLI